MKSPTEIVQPNNYTQVIRKWVAKNVFFMVLSSIILFGAAGSLRWPLAWGVLALMLAIMIVNGVVLIPRSPDLIAERSKVQEGTKSWDRILAPMVAMFGPLGSFLVAGLDFRFGWTNSLPAWLIVAAYLVAASSALLTTWAMAANRFFSGTVRIQTDRQHSVASRGPYQYVRHPGYSGVAGFQAALPLALGSLWAFVPAVITLVALVLRTALEDRTLQEELTGYRKYSRRVRSRLLPFIW